MDIKGTLDSLQIDIDGISDEPTRNIVIILSHLIEYLSAENKQLKEENQALRDEINKLKGEQGKPSIRKQSKDKLDLSTEKDRKPRGKQAKKPNSSKKGKRPIDRTERIIIAPDELPADAIFKGYQTVFVQDIIIKTENMFRFNDETNALVAQMKLSKKSQQALADAKPSELLNRMGIDALLAQLFPNPKKHQSSRRIILEASAIIAYRQLPEAISLLLVDDAPQYKQITESLAL